MATTKRWVQRHPVVAFVALAYTVSWLTWLPALLGLGGVALIILGGLGPLVAAWVVTRYTSSSVRAWALQMTRWRVPFGYYLYALGLPPLLYGLVDVALALVGYDIDPALLVERAPPVTWRRWCSSPCWVAGWRSRDGADSRCPICSAGIPLWWRP
jgi:uncharacterized protein